MTSERMRFPERINSRDAAKKDAHHVWNNGLCDVHCGDQRILKKERNMLMFYLVQVVVHKIEQNKGMGIPRMT
uniref:Uncharacterized protein n=1 Tax=Pristionchus pacificus TaxID=54126 RepID=A0A2A6C4P4_PRIPA|eukprot:PDM73023.1 hypothetical protein PRIPAC_39457 [Pristionchus pacificus]